MAADPALRDELLAMVAEELAAAEAFTAAAEADPVVGAELERRLAAPSATLIGALSAWDPPPPAAGTLLEANAGHADRLGRHVEADGWPGLRRVGPDGTDAAWMLAEHADAANERRRGWLGPLREAVERGEADPRHLATLADRVAAVAGEPQPYGTIVLLADDGEVEFPLPVADPAQLDRRRAEIGLPPVAAEAAALAEGDLVPYGPDRRDVPLLQWPIVLEGHVSVEAALSAGVRRVHRVWATRPGDRRLGRLRALARERGVTIDAVAADEIAALASGRSHGGLIALVAPRVERRLPELLREVGEGSLVVMLDGIEDPFNYGQAVRALYAAGIDAVVTRRSWETASGTVARSSAGTTELMPQARVASAEEAAAAARRAGMRVACAVAAPGAVPLAEADLRGGLFLLIGGERRGVTRSFVDEADLALRIDYGRPGAPELGAAASAAIIGFEALRQRRGAG